MCEGEEPIPHGYVSTHIGTFDWWTSCSCGHEFNTDNWEKHKLEHKICVCTRETGSRKVLRHSIKCYTQVES